MIRVTGLSSTCSAIAHEDERLHATKVLFFVNSDVMLALCYASGKVHYVTMDHANVIKTFVS
jgi:hypothetical protein